MTERSVEHRTKVPEIRKGDTVVVLSGRDAGKRGTVDRVIRVAPSASARKSLYRRRSVAGGTRVVVEGLHIAKRHTKPQQRASQSDRMPRIQQGGILAAAFTEVCIEVDRGCHRVRLTLHPSSVSIAETASGQADSGISLPADSANLGQTTGAGTDGGLPWTLPGSRSSC